MSVNQIGSYAGGEERILTVTEDGRLVAISPAHSAVHLGYSYTIAAFETLANTEVGNFLFSVPDIAPLYCHVVIEVGNSVECLYEMFEGTTVSANGSEYSSVNRNRNSTNEALMKVYSGPTVTADGSIILTSKVGVAKKYGGQVRSENEFVLKNNTNYMLRVTNLASGDNIINGLVSWYEHPNAIQVG